MRSRWRAEVRAGRLSAPGKDRLLLVLTSGWLPGTGHSKEIKIESFVAAFKSKVGHDFTHHTGEFETVTRESRRYRNIRKTRMQIEDEMFVRAVRKQTSLDSHRRPIGIGKIDSY